MSEQQLARIGKVTLGYEDHGMLSSMITLEYAEPGHKIGGTGQGFGGYGLGGEYASKWIKGLLDVVGVHEWNQLTGKYVFVNATYSKVTSITGVTTGKTFDPTLWTKEETDGKE